MQRNRGVECDLLELEGQRVVKRHRERLGVCVVNEFFIRPELHTYCTKVENRECYFKG